MNDKQLIQHLKDLEYVHASSALHAKMQQKVQGLPNKHNGFYFPLFAFRYGVVMAIVLLCVLITSGAVVAAAHSTKNTPLYPVRLFIKRIAPRFIGDDDIQRRIAPTLVPTAIPTPTIHSQIQKTGDENEDNRINGISHETQDTHGDIKGIHVENKDDNSRGNDKKKQVDDEQSQELGNAIHSVINLLH